MAEFSKWNEPGGDFTGARIMPSQPSAVVVGSSGNSSSSGGYQVGGWYNGRQWDGSRFGNPGEVIVGGGSSSGFSVPEPDYEAYRRETEALLSNYDRDEQLARDNFQKQSGLLDESLVSAQSILNRNRDDRKTYDTEQERKLNTQQESAISQAIRARNALGQNAQARFGRGSSAGQAATEIADQEFYRQQGQVNQVHLENIGQLMADSRKFFQWASDEDARLIRETRAQKTQLEMQFNTIINQIANSKNLTRAEGLRAIREARERYNTQKANLDNALKMQQLELDAYSKKVQTDLNAAIQLQNSNRYSIGDGIFNHAVESDLGFSDNATPMSTAIAPRYNPYANEDEDNPYFIYG